MVNPRTGVLVETGKTKVFAVALDWPGWARGAKNEEAALEALAAYEERYAPVAELAGHALPSPLSYAVTERVKGSGGTDFGIPSESTEADLRRSTGKEAQRQVAIMRAAWTHLDQVAAEASPTLKRGPRGGGRDRDPIVQHVIGAEAAYGRKLGIKHREPQVGDEAAISALREDLVGVLSAPSAGQPIGEKGWPARYALRRIVWHVLDHAWEIQDKSK